MFGRKVLISMIIIIIVVLSISNVYSATVVPEELDIGEYDEPAINDLYVLPAPDVILQYMIINISSLLLEGINLIISVVLLFKTKLYKKECIFTVFLNIIMIFITIRFGYRSYSIWGIIAIINLIIQIAIIIYFILKMFKKEGEKSVKNRK